MDTASTETAAGENVAWRLLDLTWRYRAGCLKLIGLQVILLALAMSGLNLVGLGIDIVRQAVDPAVTAPRWPLGWRPPAHWTPLQQLGLIALGVLLFALIRSVLNYRYTIDSTILVQRGIVVDLRAQVYDKLQRLSFRFFDANASGTLINRITGDVQSVRAFVDGVVIQTAILTLSLGVYLAFMVHIHLRLTLACLCIVPLMAVLSSLFSRIVRPAYRLDRDRVDQLVLKVSESAQGIHVIKGFTREPEMTRSLGEANRAVRDQKERIFWCTSLYSPAMDTLSQASLVILMLYGGSLVMRGEIPLGSGLIVFLGVLQRFAGQVTQISGIVDTIQQSLAAARRVFEVLDTPVEIRSTDRAVRRPNLQGAIQFERVTFGYRPEEPVLHDISFSVKPGQRVGILGTTGAGKTTLLSLIPRFYDPSAGRILADGLDLRHLHLDDLRRQIGVVFQESFLFSNTVAANIAFGHPDASPERIRRAAETASAHAFIEAMAQGYDTVLGEGGMDLSGGQRQRLALARALLLEPPLLLLDDPTAAVDPGTEQEILAAMDQAMQGRTTFLVTNRIHVLDRMDLVIVLHRGRIEQIGLPGDLIRQPGHYRRVARLQLGQDESRPAGEEAG